MATPRHVSFAPAADTITLDTLRGSTASGPTSPTRTHVAPNSNEDFNENGLNVVLTVRQPPATTHATFNARLTGRHARIAIGRPALADGTGPVRLVPASNSAHAMQLDLPSPFVHRVHGALFLHDCSSDVASLPSTPGPQGDIALFIADTGSKTGTFLNGIRLSRRGMRSRAYQLVSGDVIQFGQRDAPLLAAVAAASTLQNEDGSPSSLASTIAAQSNGPPVVDIMFQPINSSPIPQLDISLPKEMPSPRQGIADGSSSPISSGLRVHETTTIKRGLRLTRNLNTSDTNLSDALAANDPAATRYHHLADALALDRDNGSPRSSSSYSTDSIIKSDAISQPTLDYPPTTTTTTNNNNNNNNNPFAHAGFDTTTTTEPSMPSPRILTTSTAVASSSPIASRSSAARGPTTPTGSRPASTASATTGFPSQDSTTSPRRVLEFDARQRKWILVGTIETFPTSPAHLMQLVADVNNRAVNNQRTYKVTFHGSGSESTSNNNNNITSASSNSSHSSDLAISPVSASMLPSPTIANNNASQPQFIPSVVQSIGSHPLAVGESIIPNSTTNQQQQQQGRKTASSPPPKLMLLSSARTYLLDPAESSPVSVNSGASYSTAASTFLAGNNGDALSASGATTGNGHSVVLDNLPLWSPDRNSVSSNSSSRRSGQFHTPSNRSSASNDVLNPAEFVRHDQTANSRLSSSPLKRETVTTSSSSPWSIGSKSYRLVNSTSQTALLGPHNDISADSSPPTSIRYDASQDRTAVELLGIPMSKSSSNASNTSALSSTPGDPIFNSRNRKAKLLRS